MIWNAATTSIRISILLFYIHIFAIQRFRQTCWVVIGLNVASFVAVEISTGLICKPIGYSYNRTIPGGHCGDLSTFERFTAVWNLLCDAALVVLPMPILWNLQMKTKKKVGLSIVFGAGTMCVSYRFFLPDFGCLIFYSFGHANSCCRTCLLTVTRVFISAYYERDNNTKQNAIVALITGLEPILGVLIACLPFLPAVFHHVGGSPFFLGVSRVFRSINTSRAVDGSGISGRNPNSNMKNSSSQMMPRGIGKSKDAFKELPSSDTDMELNLLQQAYLDQGLHRDYNISGGSLNSTKEQENDQARSSPSNEWSKGASAAGIQVRTDFTVTNDMRV